MVSPEQLSGLTAQHNEIIKRVTNGSLDPTLVRRHLQALIQKSVPTSQSIVEQVERQLNRWRELGVPLAGKAWDDVMWQADNFSPCSPTDEPLVTAGFGVGYDNLRGLLDSLADAIGNQAVSYLAVHQCRYATEMKPPRGVRLVHYDPDAYRDMSPMKAREAARGHGLRLAGIEVLEHLLVSGKTELPNARVNLAGIQCGFGGSWTETPYLVQVRSELRLYSDRSESVGVGCTSPLVREC